MNPHHDEEGKFTSPPEQPAGPDWSSLGVDFETAQNAIRMQQALSNVNTRRQAMEQLYDPRYDSDYLAPVQAEEQPAPWQQPFQPQQPEEPEDYGYGYEPQQDDVRQQLAHLASVVQNMGQYVEQNYYSRADLERMAQQQAIEEASRQAATSAGLPDFMANAVQNEVMQITSQYTNRQPGDVAKEVAGRYAEAIRSAQVQQAAPPAPGGPPPQDAPIPGDPTPKTWDDANAQWEAAARAQHG